ncbi:hypothetical protein [Pseudobutyrivibrio sp.]
MKKMSFILCGIMLCAVCIGCGKTETKASDQQFEADVVMSNENVSMESQTSSTDTDDPDKAADDNIVYWEQSDMDRWANSITVEDIDDLAVPDESSKKTMTADEFIEYIDAGETFNDYDDAEKFVKEAFFDNKVGMSDMVTRCEGYVETYTLNKDDTITVLRYVPKETK